GGQYTYHGPGQRVVYVMLDLKKRTPDVRLFVKQLEQWIIATLAALGVEGGTREGRIGVWVSLPVLRGAGGGEASQPGNTEPGKPESFRRLSHDAALLPAAEAKIAAIGIRIRRWVTYHGIALNVNPDLSHYRGIVPCGQRDYGVTSLAALGVKTDMKEVDTQL